MPMKPIDFDRSHGELHQVIGTYLGQPADDVPDRPSLALRACLRHTWRTRPWALSVAEQQLRDYAHNPPGRLRRRLGEFHPVPDVGLPEASIQGWLLLLADHIKQSIESAEAPSPSTLPETRWEWHARFPELGEFLGGWFAQDMSDEFSDHEAAVRDDDGATDRSLVVRLVGEIRELLALGLGEAEHALAVAELGMELDPPAPHSTGSRLASVADGLSGFRPEYA
ncbi:contact-dependent growth inhibition system immunity protein [Streptomyces erythrochromogenes]|uniref:contact-dependent growth inhibition system immunity protein n=1 Tax=Streptomyces erythrochromogenes TaxID=285574 RepID=UPI00382F5048